MEITPIAYIHSDLKEKFGIPRQSGLVESLRAEVVFAPAYRVTEAVRGLEDFSHIWLIWEFSQTRRETWSPTVRPPRLGGNRRVGVFATRSPFRPNSLGLSAVRLERVEPDTPQGPGGPGAAGGGVSAGNAGTGPAGEAGGAAGPLGPGPPALLPGRPGAGLRHGLRGGSGAVYRKRRQAAGGGNHQIIL